MVAFWKLLDRVRLVTWFRKKRCFHGLNSHSSLSFAGLWRSQQMNDVSSDALRASLALLSRSKESHLSLRGQTNQVIPCEVFESLDLARPETWAFVPIFTDLKVYCRCLELVWFLLNPRWLSNYGDVELQNSMLLTLGRGFRIEPNFRIHSRCLTFVIKFWLEKCKFWNVPQTIWKQEIHVLRKVSRIEEIWSIYSFKNWFTGNALNLLLWEIAVLPDYCGVFEAFSVYTSCCSPASLRNSESDKL